VKFFLRNKEDGFK
jgi:hypothetical protein